MSDRDRLIGMIKEGNGGYDFNSLERIADHLLSNGAIVPPCKVGDTVYFIDTCITAEDFGKEFVTFETVKRVSLDNEFVIMESGRARLWEYVFRTYKEAEQALKQRKEDESNV